MTRADDGCRLWTAGTGRGTPLILCHGGPGLWDMFGSLADTLAGDQALPRVTRVILPDVGHVPWLEVPGEFASRVLDWLRQAA